MSSQKRTRKLNEPIIDKTHESTGPIRRKGPQRVAGNPVKGGKVFGNRRGKKR